MKYSILLAGIGGDSHSVGLSILRMALTANGYRVTYLGVQNSINEIAAIAHQHNVVMCSNMDGHAVHYLREFPQIINSFKSFSDAQFRPKFYLGGNLSIGDKPGIEELFLAMGFDRVYPKYVDITVVLRHLAQDLLAVQPIFANIPIGHPPLRLNKLIDALSDLEFSKNRKEVLGSWMTGRAALDLDKNAKFLKRAPNFSKKIEFRGRAPIIQPRSGVGSVAGEEKLLKKLETAGAGCLSHQVDSLTRNNKYDELEEILRSPDTDIEHLLNGFPVVNHGVASLQQIQSNLKMPVQVRHSTKDPRLLCEIAYAGGSTAFEGGAICYNIPYYKDYSLVDSLNAWSYVDYLTGLYFKRYGIVLNREYFGCLTATLIPPCIAILINLIQAILSAEAGVKSISIGLAETGNRAQDIASLHTAKSLIKKYLENLGYDDIFISTAFYQYMAAFPPDLTQASELIRNSAITAYLGNADRILTKTPVEALKIPSVSDNIHGIKLVLDGFSNAEKLINENRLTGRIQFEADLIEREVNDLFASVMLAGNGDLKEGIVIAFQKGLIDVPFSPSIYNKGTTTTVRDADGAIRILNFGNLQIDNSIKKIHWELIKKRKGTSVLGRGGNEYNLVLIDVVGLARGQFYGWPLDSLNGSI